MALNQEVGKVGEDIACEYLEGKGFSILERNYRKKWGEIDIVAKVSGVIRFVEVKSVTRENIDSIPNERDTFRPEDNMHLWKTERLSRTIQSYLAEKGLSQEGEWQFDVLTVYVDQKNKRARVEFIENIIL